MLTPVHFDTNYTEDQIDLLLYENPYCLIKLQTLVKKDSHMEHVCGRSLTALGSIEVLDNHIEKCTKQKPTNKDHLRFENQYLKIPELIKVCAEFERNNQRNFKPHNPNVLHE